MIVVDTQVVVYVTIDGPLSELAERVLNRDADWVAPILWRSEYFNVLAGQLRRGSILPSDALGYARDAAAVIRTQVEPEPESLIQLITQSRCTAYDLEYVAVAHSLGIPLVTNDQQILRDFPTIAVSLESFAPGSA
ncbi:MAG TPA: type II toxin-antitoxin system VapC family toxin [Tepidiformaceae bacterium]|nr:type II toxin-antitoxin system VapC family toxin [Tepidiformaceae bacterium]